MVWEDYYSFCSVCGFDTNSIIFKSEGIVRVVKCSTCACIKYEEGEPDYGK